MCWLDWYCMQCREIRMIVPFGSQDIKCPRNWCIEVDIVCCHYPRCLPRECLQCQRAGSVIQRIQLTREGPIQVPIVSSTTPSEE